MGAFREPLWILGEWRTDETWCSLLSGFWNSQTRRCIDVPGVSIRRAVRGWGGLTPRGEVFPCPPYRFGW